MIPLVILLLAGSLWCAMAQAAALVRLPNPNTLLPVADLEVNRGQAKKDVLFLSRANRLAVTARSIQIYPYGVRQTFAASNPDPVVRFNDPLPGVVNSFTGADPQKWLAGIPRFRSARLSEVYPGIEAQYVLDADGLLTLKLLLRPGVSFGAIAFDLENAGLVRLNPDGSLFVRLGPSRIDQVMTYPVPVAFQPTPLRRLSRTARFGLGSGNQFGFQVDGVDARLPLQIELKIKTIRDRFFPEPQRSAGADGSQFVVATVADAAGNDAPYPELPGEGCQVNSGGPIACSDAAVYKFSDDGKLIFTTYLAGGTRESISFLKLAHDGTVVVAGSTDSRDFPVTSQAFQRAFGGPESHYLRTISSTVVGDFFAARVDFDTGMLLASTYLGGPEPDSIEEAALGTSGSVYFMPKWLERSSAQMPVTAGALQSECVGDPCESGYAAHLSPSLDRLLYGTYLPGRTSATKLHSDGSLYFAGTAQADFPVTPSAYQRELRGVLDGMIARLDPSGGNLMFGTYIGGAERDAIGRIAVAPDGSVWAQQSTLIECCPDSSYRLVRLDSRGERLPVARAIYASDLAIGPEGNLIALASGSFPVSPSAILGNTTRSGAYIRLGPAGENLFATYLPDGARPEFSGTSGQGLPILRIDDNFFHIDEEQTTGVYTGRVVDSASLSDPVLSPGTIMTLFGSKLGPAEGVSFQLENGRVPTTLGGTRVLVDGEAVPILYASYWQVNAILPYSLPVGSQPPIRVESEHGVGNEIRGSFVESSAISIFQLDHSTDRPAAALNDDGSVNSLQNPAKPGSRVTLFATGGGATVPPSVAGEVTPLELRRLAIPPLVDIYNRQPLTVEFAGAAPGLVAGVTQINVKLPDVIPESDVFPRGLIPIVVRTPENSQQSQIVSIAVDPD